MKFLATLCVLGGVLVAAANSTPFKMNRQRLVPWVVAAGGVLLGASLTLGIIQPQYETADDIPKAVISSKKELNIKLARVVDGDTIRVKHVPKFNPFVDKLGRKNKNSIIVRLYGVDAPELAKQGLPGQPYSLEAKNFVEDALEKSGDLRLKLLGRDRYNRILGVITYSGGFMHMQSIDLSTELVKQGYATVYRQGGAVYDRNKQELEALENRARRSRSGMWRQDKVILPSEYKGKTRSRPAPAISGK